MRHSTVHKARGGLHLPDHDPLPDYLTRLQAKVDVANDLQRSGYPENVRVGRHVEQEVRQQVMELLQQDELVEIQTASVYMQADLGARHTISGGKVLEFGSAAWFTGIDEIPF